jgi:integrase
MKETPMSNSNGSNPFTRHKTRWPGITYRLRSDGTKTYYVHHGGKQRAVEGGEREALALQADLRRRSSRGEIVNLVSKSLSDVAEIWLPTKRHIRAATRAQHEWVLRVHLLPRFGQFKMNAITTHHVAALVVDLEQAGRSRSTIHRILGALSQMFDFAITENWASKNYVQLLTTDQRPHGPTTRRRTLEPFEISALLRAASYVRSKTVDYSVLFFVAIFTGLRLGELLGLVWGNVDLREGLIRVRVQRTRFEEVAVPKTENAIRDVILGPQVVAALRRYRVRQLERGLAGSADLLFPVGETGVRLALKRTLKRAAISPDRLSFHSFRHTYASLMIASGRVDSVFISRQMGHSTPATTWAIYAHEFDRAANAEAARAALDAEIGKILAISPEHNEAESPDENPGEGADFQADSGL